MYPSVADDRSLSFLQFEHVSAVGSVGEQEVKFGTLISAFEQRQIHSLKEENDQIRKSILSVIQM